MKRVVCLMFILVSGLSVFAQKPDWFVKLQKLQKVYSTEKDVKRLFKSAKITFSTPPEQVWVGEILTRISEYELPEGKLSVFYSAGKCSEKNKYGFDLDDGVILNYKFKSKISIEISKIKLNLKGYKYTIDKDGNYQTLENKKKGVLYMFYPNQTLVNYSLPQNYLKPCENFTK